MRGRRECFDRRVRIVLLGASGNAGRDIARLLAPHLAAEDTLVLAGRSRAKLDATAAVTTGPASVELRSVDAEDDAAVRALVEGADLVVVTVSLPHRVRALARIVADAGADWCDTLLSSREKLATLRALEPRLVEKDLCFVTDGGFHPGLPAAMVRWAGGQLDTLETADVLGAMRLDWRVDTLADSTVREMLEEFTDFDMVTYIDGAWRTLPWSKCPTVDFGAPIGRKSCVPMYLAEMETLPELFPGLRRCGFYVGGFTPAMDYLALPVIMGMLKVRRLYGLTVRFARWSFAHLASTPPPHRLVVRLTAEGVRHGARATASVEVSGDDGYLLTAAPVVSVLRRVLDRSGRRPGVWLQAHLADPERLLSDLADVGLEVRTSVD